MIIITTEPVNKKEKYHGSGRTSLRIFYSPGFADGRWGPQGNRQTGESTRRQETVSIDKGITNAGITQKIVDLVKQGAGVDTVIFDETVPNPTDTNVHDGLKVFQNEKCDLIISLGGGSPHDCGKGIGIVATNGGNIRDYEGIDKSTKPMPFCFPHVEKFNLVAKVDRFVDIAKAMGECVAGLSLRAAADKALEAIKQLSSDIGIPSGLKELGVKEKDLRTMAENAQKDACGLTNPLCPTLEDVIQIYTWALFVFVIKQGYPGNWGNRQLFSQFLRPRWKSESDGPGR